MAQSAITHSQTDVSKARKHENDQHVVRRYDCNTNSFWSNSSRKQQAGRQQRASETEVQMPIKNGCDVGKS